MRLERAGQLHQPGVRNSVREVDDVEDRQPHVVFGNVRPSLQQSAAAFGVDSARRPAVAARADPRLTQAALENLLGNAWKFTRKTPEARIEFGKTKHRGKSAYFIRDNGASFAYVGKLFAPFQRQAVR
jgi:C4-dicarboxylate-specific signal transduction histidine kinase